VRLTPQAREFVLEELRLRKLYSMEAIARRWQISVRTLERLRLEMIHAPAEMSRKATHDAEQLCSDDNR
jgi:hypothetical protein